MKYYVWLSAVGVGFSTQSSGSHDLIWTIHLNAWMYEPGCWSREKALKMGGWGHGDSKECVKRMADNDLRLRLLKMKCMSYNHLSLYMDTPGCPLPAVTHWRRRILLEVGLQVRQNCIAPPGCDLTMRFITGSKLLKLINRGVLFGVFMQWSVVLSQAPAGNETVHRIIEQLSLEGTSKDHLVPPFVGKEA